MGLKAASISTVTVNGNPVSTFTYSGGRLTVSQLSEPMDEVISVNYS